MSLSLVTDASCNHDSRQIRYSFTLKNTKASLAENIDFWVYGPVTETATQSCETIEATHAYKLITDACGNQILHFSFERIAPHAAEIISLKSNLKVWENPKANISSNKPENFLNPEPFVESGHPLLAHHAQKLKKPGQLATAESIFRWVSRHIEYSGYSGPELGAWYAFSHKKGDCTEYMNLFTALCRAAEIPCRRVGGYICPESKVVKAAGYHNWAEFYLNGKWHIADPMNRVFMKNQADYIAIHTMGNRCLNEMVNFKRFRVKAEGITVEMNS